MVQHVKFSSEEGESGAWAIEQPKLDNARRQRDIYFVDPEDGDYKETLKTQGKDGDTYESGNIPMRAVMLRKMGTKKRPNKLRETASKTNESNKIRKTQHAYVVEAHESTRKRLKSLPKNNEDLVAEKGFNSMSHYNLVHTFLPMLQAMKIPDARKSLLWMLICEWIDSLHLISGMWL